MKKEQIQIADRKRWGQPHTVKVTVKITLFFYAFPNFLKKKGCLDFAIQTHLDNWDAPTDRISGPSVQYLNKTAPSAVS